MRFVVLGAGVLLAGCVQQAYVPPQPIDLQTYPPPYTYRTTPPYRAPDAPPLGEPLAPPIPLGDPSPAPTDESGPIPLQQMPAPVPDTPTPTSTPAEPTTTATPAAAAPAPLISRPPTAGPGSNVPLEGFRPMRGQTRPAP